MNDIYTAVIQKLSIAFYAKSVVTIRRVRREEV